MESRSLDTIKAEIRGKKENKPAGNYLKKASKEGSSDSTDDGDGECEGWSNQQSPIESQEESSGHDDEVDTCEACSQDEESGDCEGDFIDGSDKDSEADYYSDEDFDSELDLSDDEHEQ